MSQKIKEVVRNGRVERRYLAYTANNAVHIRVHELLDGDTTTDTTQSFDLADDGETVVHTGERWDTYARKRFGRLNDARFTHEFQELRGAI